MTQKENEKDPFPWINNFRDSYSNWKPPKEFEGTEFAKRRQFFERNPQHRNGYCVCPSCGYPTLTTRHCYSYCTLCCWEDDGQDDPWGHYLNGGPNSGTLNQSRKNFTETMTMYSSEELDEMEGDYKKRILDDRERTIKICSLMDRLMNVKKDTEIKRIWLEIESAFKK